MPPVLFAHPFSSYCQKVLTALYENRTDFSLRLIEFQKPEDEAALEAVWPLKRFPVLVDGDRTVIESSIIIEYLQSHHPGPVRLLPEDPDTALEVRFMDRIFDNYVMTSTQRIVFDQIRAPEDRNPFGVAESRTMLDRIYAWLDRRLADRQWAAGTDFTLADCAAAPSLFYADWVYEIPDGFRHLRRYRAQLLARPSFARAVDEARPYRGFFPGGAPNRD